MESENSFEFCLHNQNGYLQVRDFSIGLVMPIEGKCLSILLLKLVLLGTAVTKQLMEYKYAFPMKSNL